MLNQMESDFRPTLISISACLACGANFTRPLVYPFTKW
jgi:hypothetical protein